MTRKQKNPNRIYGGFTWLDILDCRHCLGPLDEKSGQRLGSCFVWDLLTSLPSESGKMFPSLGISSRRLQPVFRHLYGRHTWLDLLSSDQQILLCLGTQNQPFCSGHGSNSFRHAGKFSYLVDDSSLAEIRHRRIMGYRFALLLYRRLIGSVDPTRGRPP